MSTYKQGNKTKIIWTCIKQILYEPVQIHRLILDHLMKGIIDKESKKKRIWFIVEDDHGAGIMGKNHGA